MGYGFANTVAKENTKSEYVSNVYDSLYKEVVTTVQSIEQLNADKDYIGIHTKITSLAALIDEFDKAAYRMHVN